MFFPEKRSESYYILQRTLFDSQFFPFFAKEKNYLKCQRKKGKKRKGKGNPAMLKD